MNFYEYDLLSLGMSMFGRKKVVAELYLVILI